MEAPEYYHSRNSGMREYGDHHDKKDDMQETSVAPNGQLRETCVESYVKFVACQTAVELFGWDRGDFIPEFSEWASTLSR